MPISTVPSVNYEALRWLCNIDGLSSRDERRTTAAAHTVFMKNYKLMFVQQRKDKLSPCFNHKIKPSFKSHSHSNGCEVNCERAAGEKSCPVNGAPVFSGKHPSHNIKDYLSMFHTVRQSENPEKMINDQMKTLRLLLKKPSYERTHDENVKIYSILKRFTIFSENISDKILKQLCKFANLELWKQKDFIVLGNTGLHMILHGRVVALTDPVVNIPNMNDKRGQDNVRLRSIVLETEDILHVGDCFGTLQSLTEGREQNARMFSVRTMDSNCEFLKLSTSDFSRVTEKIAQHEQTEKLTLLLSCDQYKLWPRQHLLQLARLVKWVTYPGNIVLASEGHTAPFIGLILSGECHVLRQIDTLRAVHNGKQEKRSTQVVMGTLRRANSFGEISLLSADPMKCSIVTATSVELGIISPCQMDELDEVTRKLLHQSNGPTFGHLTKEDIQNEYVSQEQKRRWNNFKHRTVIDTINYNGIRPGYGKWVK